jgi:AcrR family transcriptional regulator
MALAHHRQKHPDQVKDSILTTTLDLLVDIGINAITIDAVARKANISKGGLLHHYPSRVALIDALSNKLLDNFEARFEATLQAEKEGPARYTRAYLRASINDLDMHAARALAVLSMFWPSCKLRGGRIEARLAQEDKTTAEMDADLQLLRFAVEGFWYAQARESPVVNEHQRQLLEKRLENWLLRAL